MIEIPAVSDYHLHARQGKISINIIPHSRRRCGRVLVMPNINPPIVKADDAVAYKKMLSNLMPDVDILTTLKLTPETTYKMVEEAAEAGVAAFKVYPSGVTTNSHGGMPVYFFDDPERYKVLDAIEKYDLVLCIHAEHPASPPWDAEGDSIDLIDSLVKNYKLRIVVEHITTEAMARKIVDLHCRGIERIAGTITAHHLTLSINDVISDKFYPHNFCKPIPKEEDDRLALIEAATSGLPCFFFGSDSAPHLKNNKECQSCCAGVYSAPVFLEHLVEVFEAENELNKLNDFISTFGDNFYRREPIKKVIHLEECLWQVPEELDGIRPFRAGEMIKWKIVND